MTDEEWRVEFRQLLKLLDGLMRENDRKYRTRQRVTREAALVSRRRIAGKPSGIVLRCADCRRLFADVRSLTGHTTSTHSRAPLRDERVPWAA